MADAMRDAILNGFVDQNYSGSEELGPKILANNQQERICRLCARNCIVASPLLGRLRLLRKTC